jgi:hypothetical protein
LPFGAIVAAYIHIDPTPTNDIFSERYGFALLVSDRLTLEGFAVVVNDHPIIVIKFASES